MEMRHKDETGQGSRVAVVCAPRTGVPCAVLVGARGTRTLQPSEKSNDRDAGQLDTFFFYGNKSVFLHLKSVFLHLGTEEEHGVPNLSSDLPPNQFRVSQLLPPLRGWNPEG